MPLDSICLTAVRNELAEKLVGLKADKIQQPERDQILLTMRGFGRAEKLLICAGTGDARLHLTDYAFENPAQPPMFCMLLRKHLQGAKLLSITQPPMERLVDLSFSGYDAMGVETEKHLIVELLGRFSNIILTDATGIILDCLRRVDGSMSDARQVLPGLLYRLPPSQGKRDLLTVTETEIAALLTHAPGEMTLSQWLLDTFGGLSPLICREAADLAAGDTGIRIFQLTESDKTALLRTLAGLRQQLEAGTFTPYLLTDAGGKPKDFSWLPIRQYGALYTLTRTESFSQLLGEFYTRRDRAERMRQRSAALTKTVKNHRDRTAKKLVAQAQELDKTQNRERLRQFGDLINANLHQLQKGQKAFTTVDYYAPDQSMCTIPLDPLKTPQQNAAKYYKEYTKARNAEKYLTEQLALGQAEVAYLDSVLEEISRAEGEHDLGEIRQELTDAGYLREQKTGRKERRVEAAPRCVLSSTGAEIRVGRNNSQNDRLTMKLAGKGDVWLHTQKIHGSHVVIAAKGQQPDERTLFEAATLAAYYSQARQSKNVPVDYTQVKYVKKPNGAKPGMVIYTNYKTLYVDPDEKLVRALEGKGAGK